ncbi:MAG: M20/M25/M40 family metallo-hydrolase [Deltaproteobacteria bacterium]|nr:MAG: M20/M25/M40 family metallo-hydrolase [Deltaproteobacteria bacterium]
MARPPRDLHLLTAAFLCAALTVACDASSGAEEDAALTDTTTVQDDAAVEDAEVSTDSAGAAEDTSEPGPSVEQARYEADLAFIAAPRNHGTTHWAEVRDLCADRLADLGYDVEQHDYGTGVNVIGTLPGTDAPEEQVLLGAHFDHIPGCDGADDNGSGVAGILEAARVLAATSHARTLVVACWDEEEVGLIGSTAWVLRALERGETVVLAYNLDMIAYTSTVPNSQAMPAGFELLFPDQAAAMAADEGRGNFIAVMADGSELSADAVASMVAAADAEALPLMPLQLPDGLAATPAAADLRLSDHGPFWMHGIPALMISDTAELRYPAYHCHDGEDVIAGLDLAFATRVVAATVASMRTQLAR